jgi:hypothetical protein
MPFIMVTVLIDKLAIGLIIPVLPAPVQLRGVASPVAVVAFSGLAQFVLHTTWVLYTRFRFGWGPLEDGWPRLVSALCWCKESCCSPAKRVIAAGLGAYPQTPTCRGVSARWMSAQGIGPRASTAPHRDYRGRRLRPAL